MNNAMFDELTFTPHRGSNACIQANKKFANGYSISVVSGEGMYGNINFDKFNESTFEVAAFDTNSNFIRLTEFDDVIGHQTKDQVTNIMTALRDDPESLRVHESK
jgi:hypothetical protein